jgi:hypothetical protein
MDPTPEPAGKTTGKTTGKTAGKTAEKALTDAQGQQVPLRYIKAYDRERNRMVTAIAADWEKMRERLEALYQATEERLQRLEDMARDGRQERRMGVRGNFQVSSFDGLITVSRSARYELRFDERLQVAREIIEGIIAEKAQNVDPDLAELLRGAFRPSSDGLLSQSRVMSLFRLKIQHPRWQEAMNLIRESIESRRGKNLLAVRRKPHREAEFESILLDIAAVAPAQDATPDTAP